MVASPGKSSVPVVVVDALGAIVVAACLLGCAYFGFIKAGATSNEIQELTTLSLAAAEDLASARSACDRQRAMLETHQSSLTSERQLPSRAPLEESIQTLSRLAETHGVHVLRQNPLSSRQYPGLQEQRFALEISGAMPDLVRFLKAVEDAETWADVAYLKIISSASLGGSTPDRVATLTLSLFSADKTPTTAPAKKEG